MRSRLLLNRENVRSLLGYILLIQTLTVSGCYYGPNFVPSGAPGIVEYPIVRTVIGSLDYPVVLTVKEGQKTVRFDWKLKGKVTWDWPWSAGFGNTAGQWRFVLTAPIYDMTDPRSNGGNPICDSGWKSSSETYWECPFKVGDYLNMPLTAELEYRLGGEPTGANDDYRTMGRVFYLIKDSQAIKK